MRRSVRTPALILFSTLLAALTACESKTQPTGEEQPSAAKGAEEAPASPAPDATAAQNDNEAPADDASRAAPPAAMPAADCGHPVCEAQLLAVLPESLGELKLVKKQEGSEMMADMGMPAGDRPPLAHALYTPSGELTRGELTVNVNAMYYPQGNGAPTHVTKQPAGTVEGDHSAGGKRKAYFEVHGVPGRCLTWTTDPGQLKSQCELLVGDAVGVQVSFDGEHDPAAAQAMLSGLDLSALAKQQATGGGD